jgi:hypothetical protein
MAQPTAPAPPILRGSKVVLTHQRGNLPADTTGTANEPASTPHGWDEPAVWVHWDDKTKYSRWVPARLLRVRN